MDPEQVLLADVMAHYIEHRCMPKGYKPTAAARRASQLVLNALYSFGEHPKVADLTRIRQKRIWGHIHKQEGIIAKSIKTYMIAVRAAIHFASKPQLVIVGDDEHEVKLLNYPVTIFCDEEEIAEHIGGGISTPRQWIPTYEEFGRWLDHIKHEDDFRCVIIALNTWARNEAIFDLRVSDQVDFEIGTIDLNPPGRRQTKKRRPIIRLTPCLSDWFKYWDDNRPISQYQDTVEKRVNKIGKSIDMPDFTLYTIRHFMATQCRRTSNPVQKEQRSMWLGHAVKEGSSTTDWYETFDPDYLEGPLKATQEIIEKLNECSHRSLFAPTQLPQNNVLVFKGDKK